MTAPASPLRPARGFTLLEVMIAMALLLVGGVSVLAVFTLAVAHRVERDVESKLDLVRPEARALAQVAVDTAKPKEAPAPLVNVPTSQQAFTVSATFGPSPNQDPAWVAMVRISYRGKELPQGVLPPIFLYRNTYERSSR